MATFNIRIESTSRLAEVLPAVKQQVGLVLYKLAKDLEARAKDVVPVDTGALKSSIQTRTVGPLRQEIVVGQHYGVFVEFGTARMAAQPFITPAFEAIRSVFADAVGAAVQRGVREGRV